MRFGTGMTQLWHKLCKIWRSSEVIRYIFFGGMTTIVSWIAKLLWNMIFYQNTKYPTNLQNFILSLVCWTAGVIFAFFTNRKYVFSKTNQTILQETWKFVASRLSTLVLDIIVMQVLCNVIGLDVFISTLIAEVIVVIANYGLSKFFVFGSEM